MEGRTKRYREMDGEYFPSLALEFLKTLQPVPRLKGVREEPGEVHPHPRRIFGGRRKSPNNHPHSFFSGKGGIFLGLF